MQPRTESTAGERSQRAPTGKALLVCDMDGTVIPLDDDPARPGEVQAFADAVRQAPCLELAYATGRDLQLALEGIQRHALPEPDYVICDVGTSLYWAGNPWRPDEEYRQRLREDFGPETGATVRQALEACPELHLQEPAKQAEFKISYYIHGQVEPEALRQRVREVLEASGTASSVRTIISFDSYAARGLLDVLPRQAAKDRAVRFLAERLHLPLDRLVYAGDSGNDLDAFLAGFQSVLVANTEAWVKEQVRRKLTGQELQERIYFARAPYAAGVLEGARFFGLLP